MYAIACICSASFTAHATSPVMQEVVLLSMPNYYMDNTLSTSQLTKSLPHLFYFALKPWESKREERVREVRNIHSLKKSDIGFSNGTSGIK